MTARSVRPGTFAFGAVLGPMLFTLAWTVLGLLRPGYSPITQPISVLGTGENGWIMNDALIASAVLCIVGVVSIFANFSRELRWHARWGCAALLVVAPLGALWSGIFPIGVSGIHSLGAQFAYGSPTFALPVTGFALRNVPGWRRFALWMIGGGLVTLAALDCLIVASPVIETGTAGLWQRVLCTEILAWYVAVGYKWLTTGRPLYSPGREPATTMETSAGWQRMDPTR